MKKNLKHSMLHKQLNECKEKAAYYYRYRTYLKQELNKLYRLRKDMLFNNEGLFEQIDTYEKELLRLHILLLDNELAIRNLKRKIYKANKEYTIEN